MSETDSSDRMLESIGSFPTGAFDKDALRSGYVILPILGVIYLYGGIYILNRRYFYPSLEKLVGFIDEKYAPSVYCLANTMLYLFVMFYSTLIAGDNLGIGTILGSDAVNLLLLMGLIQYRVENYSTIDAWIFLKDGGFYLGTLILAGAFFSMHAFTWWMILIWFFYFLSYAFYFQRRNEQLRDKLALLLGLKDEDDMFSSDDNYNMKKRRYSLTELNDEKIFDIKDDELQKKIRRQEGALRIQLRDHSKYNMYSQFQRAVYCVIFAIQKKVEIDRKLRSQRYKEKTEKVILKKQKTLKMQDDKQRADDEEGGLNNNVRRDEEETLLENRDGQLNNFDDSPPPVSRAANHSDVLNRNQDGNVIRHIPADNQENNDDVVASSPNFEDIEDDDNEMAIPLTIGKKIIYFLFFPLNFLFFVILYYFKKNVNVKTASFSVFAALVLQAGLSFLIIWWTEIIMYALEIPSEIAGMSFTAIGFSVSFVVYNLKLQTHQKDSDFLTTFEMIGTYKFGLANTLGWFFYFLKDNVPSTPVVPLGFAATTFIFLGFFLLGVVVIAVNKARISRKLYIPYTFGYFSFFVIGIIVIKKYPYSL